MKKWLNKNEFHKRNDKWDKKTPSKKFHKRNSKNVSQKWFAEMICSNDSQKLLKL